MGYASNYLISGVLLKFKDFVKHDNVIVTVIAYYQFQRCKQCLNDVCCSWDTHTFFGRGMDALKNDGSFSSEGGVKVFAHDSAFGEKGERQDQKLNTEEAFRRCSSK